MVCCQDVPPPPHPFTCGWPDAMVQKLPGCSLGFAALDLREFPGDLAPYSGCLGLHQALAPQTGLLLSVKELSLSCHNMDI